MRRLMRKIFTVCGCSYLILAIISFLYPYIVKNIDFNSRLFLGYLLIALTYLIGIPFLVSIIYYFGLLVRFILK